ncbi:hypothetical protein O7634_28785 [Micromonospora sp. WMMD1120]|uniref:hypothetical protein n=1 Tax=Micromonospora sp. WMMD1120 TaxID=3016106 RepID=UPI002416F2B2|nr:hypothetical protein [Micromonospora sp. WMMD1120]MDG4810771.1 hypothetical protein [Micromonospora sp. WMMD1120]
MRRLLAALLTTATAVILVPGTASASPRATTTQPCGAMQLTGNLPAPRPGTAVRQSISIGADCQVVTGPAQVVATPNSRARLAAAYHTYSEMYDCCGIVMSALYTDSTSSTAGGAVTSSSTSFSTHVNREPWNAGWSVRTATSTGGCVTACPSATYDHHAEFSYQGIFDATGEWYYNIHDSRVVLNGDETATCQQTVNLRHTFIGWNWVHGCG